MAVKEIMKRVEELFKTVKKGDAVTFEDIAKEFSKQMTVAQSKKIYQLSKSTNIDMVSASEYAKRLTAKEKKKRDIARKKFADSSGDDEFDFTKEKEL